MLHVVGSQPCQQRLPGVGAKRADEFPGELTGPLLCRVFALQQVNEHGEGIDASSRQLVEGGGPRGGLVAGEFIGSSLEPGGIPPPCPRGFTHCLHDGPHVFVAVAEHPLKPAEAGGIGVVAQIGEQIEPLVARLLEHIGELGKIAGGDVVGLDVGGPDRGIEQGRRGRSRRKGERFDHGLSQRIGYGPHAIGCAGRSHVDRRQRNDAPHRSHSENARRHSPPPRKARAAAPSS